MFTQPGCSPSFYEQVRVNKVSLENAYMEAPFVIGGVVRVLNLDFNKTVRVRWTVNDWHSHEDVLGTYVEGSSDVVTDKFSFKIQVGKLFIFNTEFKIDLMGIVPFVATHPKGRFFVFFTVAFLLFIAPAGGSNPAGPII